MPAAAVACRTFGRQEEKGCGWEDTAKGVDPWLIEHANQYLAEDNVLFLGSKRSWNGGRNFLQREEDPNAGWECSCEEQEEETLPNAAQVASRDETTVQDGSNEHPWCNWEDPGTIKATTHRASGFERGTDVPVRPASAPNLQSFHVQAEWESSAVEDTHHAQTHAMAPRTPTAAEVSAAARAAAAVQEMASKPHTAANVARRCVHCGATKTPQWRAGPAGQKTLCNACGVRYKAGRLTPRVNFPPTEEMCKAAKSTLEGVGSKLANASKRRKV